MAVAGCEFDTGEPEVSCLLLHERSSSLCTGHECLVKIWNTSHTDNPQSIINITSDDVCEGEVTCVCELDDKLIAIAIDQSVLVYDRFDLSKPRLTHYNCTREDINHLAVNKKGDFLSVCDDSGEILIIDVHAGKKFKTCKRHDNICSCAVFNQRRQWEIISGGLDCQLITWDYSKGRRLSSIDMNKLTQSCNSSVSSSHSINPPMIHTLCNIKDTPIVAVGLGNGYIVLVNTSTGRNKPAEIISFTQIHSSSVNTLNYVLFKPPTVHHTSLEPEKYIDDDIVDRSNKSDNDQVLLSGGNDAKLMISTLITTPHVGSGHDRSKGFKEHITGLRVTRVIEHGSKINQICCIDGGEKCYVADLTNKITVYDVCS